MKIRLLGPIATLGLSLAACSRGDGPNGATAASSSPAAPAGQVRLTQAPESGTVRSIVVDAMAKAATEKRKLVVYEGASWCDPCKHFHKAVEKGELDALFPDVTLLEFDHDRDSERLAVDGYVSRYIPLFAIPGQDGSASGKQIEGGVKGEGAVDEITPRLRQLLGR
jgi:hypothetical protein